MVRAPSIDKNGLKKGAWSEEEDNKLRAYVQRYGYWNWRQLPKFAGLARCGKSCRLRWKNYLEPGVRRGNYTHEEEELILKLHEEHGNKWSLIASKLPGRTDNEIKNQWHTHLSKNMKRESRSTNTSEEIIGRSSHRMDASDHNQQSSSLSTFDSIRKNDHMETSNVAADTDHIYSSEVSFLSVYDPTIFDGVLDWTFADSLSPVEEPVRETFGESFWSQPLSPVEEPVMETFGESFGSQPLSPVEEPVMETFGESFWSQPFSLDTSYNNTLQQQLPPLEDEIMCPFTSYLDDNDIVWMHELLQS